ncbi:GFA family protein [Lysobacter niabensis]|uniref:GFA family protein n=1 Tax=Agrilutibacter niabensis TaxID=380628 RepID=UPI003607F9B6
MSTLRHDGGCHCGAVRWSFESRLPLPQFAPRACDCDFCTRHRAAWVSDADGSLQLRDADGQMRRYRQGSGQADFMFCGRCGVLVGVVCPDDHGMLRGAVNRNGFDERHLLGDEVVASPQRLAPEAKRTRWSQLWTPTRLA